METKSTIELEYDVKSTSTTILKIERPKIHRSLEKTIGSAKIHNTLDDIKEALYITKGNLTKASEVLGVKRAYLKRKIDSTPSLQLVLADVIERKLDVAEEKLMEQVEVGNVTATTFVLKTLGKNRGYTEKSTLEHELSDKHMTSASIIEAMRKTAKEVDSKPKLIEDKGGEWEE